MKNFTIGFICGIIGFLFISDCFKISMDWYQYPFLKQYGVERGFELFEEKHPFLKRIDYALVYPGLGLVDMFTKRCTKDIRSNDQTRREFFQCNRVEIFISDLIFGEYSSI